MKFAANGTLYRGSKPVMWSVVEKTALAEAEIEYEDFVSDQVWVKFPLQHVIRSGPGSDPRQVDWNSLITQHNPSVVIWTTTPWTIPGNRAISFSPKIEYGLYEVVDGPSDNWAKVKDRFILADKLAIDVFRQARVTAYKRLSSVSAESLEVGECVHPLASFDARYGFRVPLLSGDHVTDDVGTGFVHTAPGHGRDDFEIWTKNAAELAAPHIY